MVESWPGGTPADLIDDIGHAIAERYRRIEDALIAKLKHLYDEHLEAPDDLIRRHRAIQELREQAQDLVNTVPPEVLARLVTEEAAKGASAEISRLLLDFPVYAARGVQQVTMLTQGGALAVAAAELDLRDSLRALNSRILRLPVDAYQRMTSEHIGSLLTGLTTGQALHRRILDQYLADGITGFIDKSGRRWTIGAYSEMATRTAAARAWGDQARTSMQAHNITTFTPVVGNSACEHCGRWQGKILTDGGPTGDLTVPHAITGEPTVIYVDATLEQWRESKAGHPNCFPGYVPVRSELGIRAADSRWYEGELVVVHTTGGRELSVTPNHPVLTTHGWVAAGALVEGDDLLSYHGGVEVDALGNPDHVREETPIGEVFESLRQSVNVSTVSMPGAAEQFHGDGFDSEVDVVLADGLLGHDGKPLGFEELAEVEFLLRRVRQSALLAKSTPLEVLDRALHATDSLVRRAGEPAALLRAHLAHAHGQCVAVAPDGTSGSFERSCDSVSLDTMESGELREGGSGLVFGADLSIGHSETSTVDPVPGFGEQSSELVLADSNGGRDLRDGLAGLVSTVRVVKVERENFAGHVYNLETAGGWYTADSIVVHNCRCVMVPALPGGPDPTKYSTWDPQKQRDRDKLRELERDVREAKRNGTADDIGEAQAALREHVERTGITRRGYREQLPFADGGEKNPRGRTKPTNGPAPDVPGPRVGVKGTLGDQLRSAREVIQSIHVFPEVVGPTVSVRNLKPGVRGQYSRGENAITMSSRATGPALTFAHEYGHHLDWVFGGSREIGGRTVQFPATFALNTRTWIAWDRAVSSSAEVQSLRALQKAAALPDDARAHLKYLLSSNELWARSYAQYIATESRNKKMLEALNTMLDSGDILNSRRQWSSESFAPIRDTIEAILREAGLIS